MPRAYRPRIRTTQRAAAAAHALNVPRGWHLLASVKRDGPTLMWWTEHEDGTRGIATLTLEEAERRVAAGEER